MKHLKVLLCSLPLLLSGCASRLTDWAGGHAQQGKVREVPKNCVKKYLKTIRIYENFSTLGIFDALWLAPQVRQAYTEVHRARYDLDKEWEKNKDKETDEAFVRKQRIEQDNFISFYVLAFIPETNAPLGDPKCTWAIDLKVNNKLYRPVVVETAELAPEYVMFLSNILSKHKQIYLVKFDAKDGEGNLILAEKTRMLELRFNTLDRSASLVWYLDKNQTLRYHDGRA